MTLNSSLFFNKRFLRLFILAISLLGLALIQVQQGDPKLDEADTIAITKSSFLFQFAISNDWPDIVKTGSFKIGIHGNKVLFEFLRNKYASQSIGNQRLEIVWFEEAKMTEFVHILYSESTGNELAEIIASTYGEPVMMVTSVANETPIPREAVVNFVTQQSRIRYELNMQNAVKRGLLVGNRILSWSVTR